MMNTSILGSLVFVLVFAGIILTHELGHFFVARLFKIRVDEFGIGLPPRLLRLWRGKGSIRVGEDQIQLPINFILPFEAGLALHSPVTVRAKRLHGRLIARTVEFISPDADATSNPLTAGDATLADNEVQLNGILNDIQPGTEFTLNWIPLGGFNRFPGEDNPDLPGGLASVNPFKRILVLLAGATMNLLTAVIVYSVLFTQVGIPARQGALIGAINPGSPAEQAGLRPGDLVLQAAGMEITSTNQLIEITHAQVGQPLALVIRRENELFQMTVTPRTAPPEGEGPMGISIGYAIKPVNFWYEALPESFRAVGEDISTLLSLPGRIISGSLSSQEAQIGGPRTLWNLFQQSVARDVASREVDGDESQAMPTNYTLLIIISLTVTVGVANLLPIPALDGGRIFMSLIEVVARRKIPSRYQMAINGVSYVILLLLLGFFYIKDIISPVVITLP